MAAAEPEGAKAPVAEPEEGEKAVEPPRARDGYLLALSSGLSFGSEIAVRQAGAQLWLNFFAGNTVAFAVSRGKLMPAIHLISFIVTPIMGGLSDTFGRKPMMLFAQAVQLLAFGGILMFEEGSSFALYMMELLSVSH
jgi:nitrate/nitrite transporter NarK